MNRDYYSEMSAAILAFLDTIELDDQSDTYEEIMGLIDELTEGKDLSE